MASRGPNPFPNISKLVFAAEGERERRLHLNPLRLGEADGKTKLCFEHSIFGKVSAATAESLATGWNQLFGECLKPFAEATPLA